MSLALLPRPAMPHGKSERMDHPDGYLRNILDWRSQAMSEAILGLESNREYSETSRYIDWLEGVQWDPGRPAYRSKFYDNRMAQARREALSSLTNIRPAIDVSSRVKEYEGQATIADRCIRDSWMKDNVDLKLISTVDHALFGTGFVKLGACSPGQLFWTACGADEVLPIQMGKGGIQNSQAVLYRAFKSLPYFLQTFGERAKGLERESVNHLWSVTSNRYEKPGDITQYTWDIMSPAMRYRMAMRNGAIGTSVRGDLPAFPIIELQEYWVDDPSINEFGTTVQIKHPDLELDEHNYHYRVPPGYRLFPRKRLIVFGGDRPLYDGPAMYWHGLFPFGMLQLNPCVWQPGGISKYRDILPLCQANNEIGAGILDLIKKAIRPQMITKRGAVDNSAWKNFFADLPGAKLQLTPIANVQADIKYMDPPALPAYVGPFQQYLLSAIGQFSGTLDIGALKSKKQVPGADSVEQMRDSMSAPFQLEARYIEALLRDLGVQAVSNIFQFYTLHQRLRLLGASGQTWEDYDYNPDYMTPWTQPQHDHWKLFSVQIAPGSLLGSQNQQRKTIAVALRRQRDISRNEMLRAIDWPGNHEQIRQELLEEEKEGLLHAAGGGRVPRLNRSQRNGSPI